MPGAMAWDCENELNARLNSWTTLCVQVDDFAYKDIWPGLTDSAGLCLCCSYHRVTGYDVEDPTPCAGVNPNAIPKHWVAYAPPQYIPDRHPQALEIEDPVKLSFDPILAARKDDGRGHEGVAFHQIWSDPLARMVWMVMKPRMLTDQFFRENCIEFATRTREDQPRVADEVRLFHFFGWLSGAKVHLDLRIALYPHIVRILLDEGRWPYLMPPKPFVAAKQLSWVVVSA